MSDVSLRVHDKVRGHSLVPTAEELEIVPLLRQSNSVPVEEKTIHLRYFAGASAQWLIAEVEPSGNWLMFGWCDLGIGHGEWGYVSLLELAQLEYLAPHGMTLYIERDFHFAPTQFGDIAV